MQLKIERTERKRGLFTKKTEYVIQSQLLCSEEERMAAKKLQFDEMRIIEEYQHDGINHGNRRIGYWIDKGLALVCSDIHKAEEIEGELKDGARTIKDRVVAFLDSGAATNKSETIDL